jgi:hypothetical protein
MFAPTPDKALDVASNPRECLFVGDDRREDTFYPGQPDEPRDSTGVIRMVVREDDRIQVAHPLARQCRSQHVGVRTNIHQDRMPAVPDQNGISLTYVEHHERCSSRTRKPYCGKEQQHRTERRQRTRAPSGGRKWPPGPDSRCTAQSSYPEPPCVRFDTQRGTGKRREAPRNPSHALERECRNPCEHDASRR